jgi:hypothetical protein
MKTKILLCSLLGLFGVSSLIFLTTKLTHNSIKQAIPTERFAIAIPPSKNLPQNLETAVREKMGQQLEINSKLLKLNKSQIATWKDCLPDKSGLIPLQPCPARSRSGWRVTMTGQGENWVYYVTNSGFITLDAIASLNKTILSNLSTRLLVQPNKLRILAAQLTKGVAPCPVNATCKAKPTVGWRILVEGTEKPFFLGLDGKELNYGTASRFLPQQTAQMPRNIGERVLQDVLSRQNMLTPNLRVESIKAIKWNWCRGTGTGPTRPEMGNCPDVEQAGWQMSVINKSDRYIYYIPKTATSDSNFIPLPDGMQSLPASVVTAIQKDAAKRAKVPENMINLHWTTPKFFDHCLNINNQKLHCRQSIQAGWQVKAVGGKVPSATTPTPTAAWIYNVNLGGNDIRFLQSSTWYPVP